MPDLGIFRPLKLTCSELGTRPRQNPNYLIATKYINEDKDKADESKGKYGMLDKAKTQDFISFAVNNKYGIMGDKGNVIVEPHYTYEEILGIVKKLKAK